MHCARSPKDSWAALAALNSPQCCWAWQQQASQRSAVQLVGSKWAQAGGSVRAGRLMQVGLHWVGRYWPFQSGIRGQKRFVGRFVVVSC